MVKDAVAALVPTQERFGRGEVRRHGDSGEKHSSRTTTKQQPQEEAPVDAEQEVHDWVEHYSVD